eukprot:scaffold140948_cov20-Tisochrysis_lutea.AAC.1
MAHFIEMLCKRKGIIISCIYWQMKARTRVYDVPSSTCLLSGPCPLSYKATLTWIGFTDEGMVATADSAGIIRIRQVGMMYMCVCARSMGGAKMPVWAGAAICKYGSTQSTPQTTGPWLLIGCS